MTDIIYPPTAAALTKSLAVGKDAWFDDLAYIFRAISGLEVITILATAPDNSVVHRVATSHTEAFPIGGFDPIDDGPWCRRIFGERQPIIANTIDEMSEFIPETAELVAMGYNRLVCMPIIIAGEVRGTINFIGAYHEGMAEEVFSPDNMAALQSLLPIAALIFTFKGISER